jgi:hypothetical protein
MATAAESDGRSPKRPRLVVDGETHREFVVLLTGQRITDDRVR